LTGFGAPVLSNYGNTAAGVIIFNIMRNNNICFINLFVYLHKEIFEKMFFLKKEKLVEKVL
jgi:hypothetical protein